jgi:hypothetical protein
MCRRATALVAIVLAVEASSGFFTIPPALPQGRPLGDQILRRDDLCRLDPQ